jgi:hypothetical protein
MISTNIAQFSKECNSWRHSLHYYRDEFNKANKELPDKIHQPLTTEDLAELGHFQNQFYIQLINIHDLRQAVKQHNKKVHYEVSHNGGYLSDRTVSDHAHLHEQYLMLETTLQGIRKEYKIFMKSL